MLPQTPKKNPQRRTAFSEHPILTTPLDLQGIHKNLRNLSKSEQAKPADLRKGRMPTRNKVLGFDLATWLRTPESRSNVENVDMWKVQQCNMGAMKRSQMIQTKNTSLCGAKHVNNSYSIHSSSSAVAHSLGMNMLSPALRYCKF